MRTFIIASLAAATAIVPAAANAQSWREAQQSTREAQRSAQDLRDAQRYGNARDVRNAREELREDRQEAREDWRDYRRSNPNVYRGQRYNGPRGYRYRTVTPGYRFAPAYYGRNYWVNDYGRYRLARPAAGTQWVRYGNDVALVNLRTGRVIQVHSRFFY